MPTEAAPLPTARLKFDYQSIVRGAVAVCVFFGFVAFIEPSPYDLLFPVALALWAVGGFSVHRSIVPLLMVVLLYELGGFISLIPFLDEKDSVVFVVLSFYLGGTSIAFALFFAEDTQRRLDLCLKAYAASTVLAAIAGILGYFDIAGLGRAFTLYTRASGTFKDPNVLGSYLVVGGVYFVQALVLQKTRHVLVTSLSLIVVAGGIFLSFSRGSWGAFIVATTMSIGMAFVTSADAAARRRIVMMGAAAATAAVLAVVVLLAIGNVSDVFAQRFALEQDYDAGETGRFGNQLRSIPLLLDSVNGMGPLRFRLFFGIEPHDTYINAFASYGWLGGFAFALLVVLTTYVGFRVALKPSPFRASAQVVWPSLLVFFLQAFQIDIDHWRHVFFLLGAVWGLETARLRWMADPRAVRPNDPASLKISGPAHVTAQPK